MSAINAIGSCPVLVSLVSKTSASVDAQTSEGVRGDHGDKQPGTDPPSKPQEVVAFHEGFGSPYPRRVPICRYSILWVPLQNR